MPDKNRLTVAMIGHGFMGAAHSQGWRVAPRFFDLDALPVMQVVVGRTGAEASAEKWGWQESASDWREVIARDDIDIVDIVTPGDSHAEIAIAALEAGKHVLCEKPLANTVAEAEAMTAAAARAAEKGVVSMLGHTYRRLPATTFARDLVAALMVAALVAAIGAAAAIGFVAVHQMGGPARMGTVEFVLFGHGSLVMVTVHKVSRCTNVRRITPQRWAGRRSSVLVPGPLATVT